MATRFYFPSSGAAAVSPAFDAGWEQTGEADRIALVRAKDVPLSTLTNKQVTVPITTTQDILARQYVSEALPAGISFDGTVRLVVRVVEGTANANATLAVVIRVVSNDGSTFRGTLFSTFTTDTEFPTTAATRVITLTRMTNVVTQEGDRLVIEIGCNANAPAGADTATFRFGTSANTDFAFTTALTTDLKPWVDFSDDLFNEAKNNNLAYIKTADGMSTNERFKPALSN